MFSFSFVEKSDQVVTRWLEFLEGEGERGNGELDDHVEHEQIFCQLSLIGTDTKPKKSGK